MKIACAASLVLAVCSLAMASDWTPIPSGPHVCVSHSGNDTTGDGSEAHPYATTNKARTVMTPGYDLWLDSGIWPSILDWTLSGTVANPTVIMTWPGRNRAHIQGGDNQMGFAIQDSAVVNNLWLVDLSIKSVSSYPMSFLGSGSNIRIEGCHALGGNGVRFQGWPNPSVNRWANITWFRSFVSDAPGINGLFVGSADGFSMIESAIIRCGGVGDLRHQDLYVHQSGMPGSGLLDGCIFGYPSAGGAQLRIGGTIKRCIAHECGVGLQMGSEETELLGEGNDVAYRAVGTIEQCSVNDGANVGTEPRGFAYWFDKCDSALIDCIAVNNYHGDQPVVCTLRHISDVDIINNTALNWTRPGNDVIEVLAGSSTPVYSGNNFTYAYITTVPPPGYFSNPYLNLTDVALALGVGPTEEDLWTAVVSNSKSNWCNKLTAYVINDMLRESVNKPRVFCPADINFDEGVDVNDLLMYLTEFEAGACNADMNYDNGVDINDLLQFLSAFESGC